jgi:hypothetical protein
VTATLAKSKRSRRKEAQARDPAGEKTVLTKSGFCFTEQGTSGHLLPERFLKGVGTRMASGAKERRAGIQLEFRPLIIV